MDLRDPRFSFGNNLSPLGSHAKRLKNVDENLFFGTAFMWPGTKIISKSYPEAGIPISGFI